MKTEERGFIYICDLRVRFEDINVYYCNYEDGIAHVSLVVAGCTVDVPTNDVQEAKAIIVALDILAGGTGDVLELAGLG